jgi:hypothetical protein
MVSSKPFMPDFPQIDAPSRRVGRQRRVVAAAPPLGVRHWLLWFTCCAAYLAAVRALADRPPGAMGVLIAAAFSVGYGAAWAGLALFIARRCGTKTYPIEPGEWLLAILGARLAAETLLEFAPPWIVASPKGLLAAATGVLLVLPLLSRNFPAVWKAVTSIMLLLYAAPAAAVGLSHLFDVDLGPFAALAGWLDRVRSPVVLAMLAAVLWFEHRRKTRYGWLHVAGIAAWIWVLGVALCIRH